MPSKRAHVLLPDDLLREIDSLVGPRGRSAFLVETARTEVRRQRLLQFLESKGAAWKETNHPELAEGADVWVRKLRTESDNRSASRQSRKRRARNH
jgi:metal-responsive CopG/Arc/MetJ family transcriptional regulator